MNDLIDREMLRLKLVEMRKFDDKVGRTDWKYRDGVRRVEQLIREAPSVDTELAQRGYWVPGDKIDYGDGFKFALLCSVCHEYTLYEPKYKMNYPNYCPNCGTKIDKYNT